MTFEQFRLRFRISIVAAWLLPPGLAIPLMSYLGFYELPDALFAFTRYSGVYVLLYTVLAVVLLERCVLEAARRLDADPSIENILHAEGSLVGLPPLFAGLYLPYFILGPISGNLSLAHFKGYDYSLADHLFTVFGVLPPTLITAFPMFFMLTGLIGRYMAPRGVAIQLTPLWLKLCVVGLVSPLVIATTMLLFYYDRTGYLSVEALVLWFALIVVAAAGTVFAWRSFQESLSPLAGPVAHMIEGRVGDAAVVPTSLDELGAITRGWSLLLERIRSYQGALERSERRLLEAQQIAHVGSWESDARSGELLWSEQVYRIFEIDAALMTPSFRVYLTVVHPDDRETMKRVYRRSLGRRGPSEHTHRLQFPDGRIKWVHERWESDFDQHGERLVSRGTVQDVTEITLAEQALRESESQLRQAVTLAGLGYWVWDAIEDRCIYSSEENARLHGVSVQEYLDASASQPDLLDTVHDDDRDMVRASFDALRQGQGFDIEYRLQTWDGELRYVREVAMPEFSESGAVIREYGAVMNMTEVKLKEVQLRQAQKMEAVGQLTGGLAHDFNNLLAVIQGNAELIADECDSDTRELVMPIVRATQRGAELTHRLLAFTRQQALYPQSIEVAELVRGMSALLDRTLGETIEVQIRTDAELWNAWADPGQLENALLNLALNARDAMPAGGRLRIEASNAPVGEHSSGLAELAPGDYVRVCVRDTGCGIPADHLEHVFEPFFSTKEVGKGSGLGLSMVYGFATQTGGAVAISSEAGNGARVELYLPRAEATPEIVEPDAREARHAAGEESILLVEDDSDVRKLAVRMLVSLGYEVTDVENVSAAREAVHSGVCGFDLILLDVVLRGGTSGPEFAEEVRAQDPEASILFMSGYSARQEQGAARLDPGTALLAKPFALRELARAVRETLDRDRE